MSRTLVSNRVGDLGITKALHLYGTSTSNVDFGVQTFLDGKAFTFCSRIWSTNSAMTDDGVVWSYGFSTGADKGYVFRPNATTRVLQFFFGGSNVSTANYWMIGKHYLFVEFDGTTTLRVYRNTTLTDTLSITARVANAATSTFLGCRDTSARFFNGVIGDSAIYSRVLTASEKKGIVNSAIYPSSGAEIVVKCNENTGTSITDYSGNSRTGTLGTGLWRNSPFSA